MNRDHDFRAHLPNDVRRQVIHQSAIHEDRFSIVNW